MKSVKKIAAPGGANGKGGALKPGARSVGGKGTGKKKGDCVICGDDGPTNCTPHANCLNVPAGRETAKPIKRGNSVDNLEWVGA